MKIRKYKPSDCEETRKLFYETIHTINAGDYTKEQRDAWSAGGSDLKKWNRSLLEHYALVAEEDGKITGFGDIDENGYLDRLFVHKDYQNKGVGKVLCQRLEETVKGRLVTTEASITAKPFFEKMGYRVIKEQQVQRQGVFLTNYQMRKEKDG